MPNLDETGPMSGGPRTGRGMGMCRGCGCGRGFGFRRFFSPKNELAALEDEEKMLEEELIAIREEKASLANEGK